jgi:hypothetical protein
MDTHKTLGYREETRATAGELETTRVEVSRLIVLVPDHGVYGMELARRIWSLAAPCELKVLFLCALETETAQESAMRLRLATLGALIRDEKIQVETHIVTQQTWVEAVWHVWQPGDIVICCAEHRIATRIQGDLPLSQMIEYILEVPTYVLPGMYAADPAKTTATTRSVSRWLALLLIIASFYFIEKQVAGISLDLAHLFFLAVIALAGVGLLAAWALLT